MKIKISDSRDGRTIEIEGDGEDAAKALELAKEFLCPKPVDLSQGASHPIPWSRVR